MNYTKHYTALIERAKIRTISTYTEQHHVIPRCMGGTDDTSNLVALTPEEHYVAHQLLVKMHPGNSKLIFAANMMTVSRPGRQNNKCYGWLKRKYLSECRKRTGKNNPSYGKLWYYDPLTEENGKFLIDDIPVGWIAGRKTITPVITNCQVCNEPTNSSKAKWCSICRQAHITQKRNGAIKQPRTKDVYSELDKRNALIANNGNIRKALFSLGLGDSGGYYSSMRKIKSSL
jgi:hypothetical protein